MKVVVASRNRHKINEIAALFRGRGWQLVAIDEVAPGAVLREDEATFEDNALAKAKQASAVTSLAALADDSGLEVDALAGTPGVRSARYAGDPCDDTRNNEKLLAAMSVVPADRRSANYRCAAAFVDPARKIELVRSGACPGRILTAPQGPGGFGYDPLFWLEAQGKSMAQISAAEKNRISHRAIAFLALIAALDARDRF